MFIVIVLGVLLIIGIAYVYKKVKALRASTAFNKVEEAFNKVKEAKKAKEEARKAYEEAKEALNNGKLGGCGENTGIQDT